MEKKQPPCKDVDSPPSDSDSSSSPSDGDSSSPPPSDGDSSPPHSDGDSNSYSKALAFGLEIQEYNEAVRRSPSLLEPIPDIEDTQQKPARQSPRSGGHLEAMLDKKPDVKSDISPLLGSAYSASNIRSAAQGSPCLESSLLSPTKSPSSKSPSKAPSSPSPTKISRLQAPSTSSTYIAPSSPSRAKNSDDFVFRIPSVPSPTKRSSVLSPTKRAGSRSSVTDCGSPSPVKQPKLYHGESDQPKTNMFLQIRDLFKYMECIHFHPIHEFCTCGDISEEEPFHIPDSTKVVKTISEEVTEIRVDVRFYEIKNIFVRIEEDKISVEAYRRKQEICYEYHHIYLVFSIPGKLRNKGLRATIKNGELIIKSSDPESSGKETDTIGGVKQKQASTRSHSENVPLVEIGQGEKCHKPLPVPFTVVTSSNEWTLKLNVQLFGMNDITVNLIEDKIVVEAKREAHDYYEFHYLHRAVDMPIGLQESSLSAKIRNGELIIKGIIKTEAAKPRKIKWLTSQAKPVLIKSFVRVPVVGYAGPYSPELSRFTGSICDGKFSVKLDVSMFEKDHIYVRPKDKMIIIEAVRSDRSPSEFHSVIKCFELPMKAENFDIKLKLVNSRLMIEGTVKHGQNNLL